VIKEVYKQNYIAYKKIISSSKKDKRKSQLPSVVVGSFKKNQVILSTLTHKGESLMILSKEYNSSILSENIQTGFLKAEDCEKMQQLLTKKLIVILKNTETEKRETLQLISNYIPECYSQAQLNNLNTTNYKHKNIIIF